LENEQKKTVLVNSQDTMREAVKALDEVNKELAELEEEENKIQKEVVDVKADLDRCQNLMKENQAKLKHWKKEVKL
jgi:peptidoglycan hydrolase CwlO-like protein